MKYFNTANTIVYGNIDRRNSTFSNFRYYLKDNTEDSIRIDLRSIYGNKPILNPYNFYKINTDLLKIMDNSTYIKFDHQTRILYKDPLESVIISLNNLNFNDLPLGNYIECKVNCKYDIPDYYRSDLYKIIMRHRNGIYATEADPCYTYETHFSHIFDDNLKEILNQSLKLMYEHHQFLKSENDELDKIAIAHAYV